MLQISQLKLPCGKDRSALKDRIQKALKLKGEDAFSWTLLRHSVDARKKPDLYDVYTVGVTFPDGRNEDKLAAKLHNRNICVKKVTSYRFPKARDGAEQLRHRPVVIGFGPAGLFCALMLAEQGYRPLVLERGQAMEDRIKSVETFWQTGDLDSESNIQFGEGGAGTFSDGKLTTSVKDPAGRNKKVMEVFISAGAPEEIAWEQLPHIGTDVLREVIRNLRLRIISLGGEIRFSSCVTDFQSEHGVITGLTVKDREGTYELEADCVVLAPGHSSRDTIRTFYQKELPMTQKAFAVGFRVTHPQGLLDHQQYGISDRKEMDRLGLPAVSYKVTAHPKSGRGVYSFCMCPGGYIVNASSEPGRLAVNGMSDYARDSARANSAIVMTVNARDFGSDDVLAGMEYQERLETRAYELAAGRVPVESYADFKEAIEAKAASCAGRSESNGAKAISSADFGAVTGVEAEKEVGREELRSLNKEENGQICDKDEIRPLSKEETDRLCIKGRASLAPLHQLFPDDMNRDFIEGMESFEKRIPGFTNGDTYLAGLESRTSSPVRITRDENGESAIKGLYPCGEGAGYAGGITSASIDGIKTAELIATRFRPADT